MQSNLLLPNKYKTVGILLFIPFLVLGILNIYYGFEFKFLSIHGPIGQNFTDEVVLTGLVISLLMIAFAREKKEDEYINLTRLESWQWAVLVNYILLIASTWIVYDAEYFQVMIYNMLTVLIIFIIRFNWILLRNKRAEEKQ